MKSKKVEEMTIELIHDIRSPLTVINMMIYSIEQALKNNPEKSQDLDVIRTEIKKVDQLLDRYKIEVNKELSKG